MLTLLKGSAVAAGLLAATVTGIVFARTDQAGQGSAAAVTVSAGAPIGSHHRHHGHHGHRGTQGSPGANTTSNDYAIA